MSAYPPPSYIKQQSEVKHKITLGLADLTDLRTEGGIQAAYHQTEGIQAFRQDAKGLPISQIRSMPPTLRPHSSAPEPVYRSAGINMSPPILDLPLHLGRSVSNNSGEGITAYNPKEPKLPTLPASADKMALIAVTSEHGSSAAVCALVAALDKLGCSHGHVSDFKIHAKTIEGDSPLHFTAGLCSPTPPRKQRQGSGLLEASPVPSKRGDPYLLDMVLVGGDRGAWRAFIPHLAQVLGGTVDTRASSFARDFNSHPPLPPSPNDPTEFMVDGKFIEACVALANSSFTENKKEGLRGLKHALMNLKPTAGASGILGVGIVSSIQEALKSRNPEVLFLASDVLALGMEAFAGDDKIVDTLETQISKFSELAAHFIKIGAGIVEGERMRTNIAKALAVAKQARGEESK